MAGMPGIQAIIQAIIMVKWKVLIAELIVLLILTWAVMTAIHFLSLPSLLSLPPKLTIGTPPLKVGASPPVPPTQEAVPPIPPKVTVSPTPIRHPTPPTRHRTTIRTRKHVIKGPRRISCRMVPAVARLLDRNTIIAAAHAKGLTDEQTKEVLACAGK